MAVSDYFTLRQRIEGQSVAELCWGTPNAKAAVFRFAALPTNANRRPISVAIQNVPATHSIVYECPLALAGSIWTEYSLVIPPCTVGTWATDTSAGISVIFCLYTGATYQTPNTGIWQSGIYYGTANQGIAPSAYAGVYISETGFYVDPYQTGVAPPYVQPDTAREFRRCQRYWSKSYGLSGGATSGVNVSRMGMRLQVPMRTYAAQTIKGAPRFYDGAVTAAASTLASTNSNPFAMEIGFTTPGTFTAGKAVTMYYQDDTSYIVSDARM